MDESRVHKVLLAYERGWMLFSLVMLFVFLALIAYTLATHTKGLIPAGALEHVDPTKVRAEGPFAQPGVIQTGPNQYTAYVQAFTFGYLPNPVEVPKGAEITFKITSPDVIHDFYVEGTDINVEVIPGEVSTVKYTFKKTGEYRIICNQYCGIGHQNMFGKIVVKE